MKNAADPSICGVSILIPLALWEAF